MTQRWRIDFHVHTCFSPDSLASLEDVLAACRSRGLRKVAITDHNTIAGALALREMAPDLVIVGEEIKTTEGELIAYFLEEEVPGGLSPEETIARLRAQKALIGAPHPLDRLRREAIGERRLRSLQGKLDFLEALNSRCLLPVDNRRAAELAHRWGLPVTAGSDAHMACEIGQAWVEMPPFRGRDDFLTALAQGRVGGGLSTPLVHLASFWAKLYRMYRRKGVGRSGVH